MNTVNETMAVITKNMMPALQSLDLNKIDKLMEQFTANCGAIDKALDVTDKAFEKSDANMTDVAGVDDLMNEVSDEVAHATGELLSTVPKRNLHPISGVDEPLANVALSLEARLKRLEVYGV
jgi:division protein CdvB (Snf7/Vps24/ESCRT-III family)